MKGPYRTKLIFVLCLIMFSTVLFPSSALAAKKFNISQAKSGFTKNVVTVNSSDPVVLKIQNKGSRNETQTIGCLNKKYTSWYLDQVFNGATFIKPVQLPAKMSFLKSNGTAKTASIQVGTSASMQTGSQVGIDKFLTLSACKQMGISTSTSYSVTNTEEITTAREDTINNYGRYQYAGYFTYKSFEYSAYQVKWNSKNKQFEKVGSGFTYYVHVPDDYQIVCEIKEYINE